MDRLRIGVARMKVFRVHPSTIKKVVNIELNGEFNFKAAHYAHSVINRTQVVRRILWISAIPEKRLKFKLLSRDIPSVDVTCAEARNTFVLAFCCEINANIERTIFLSQAQKPTCHGKTSAPSRAPCDYWNITKLCRTFRCEQDLAPDFVDKLTKSEYKSSLLVMSVTVIGLEKPWSILIDSGASSNYGWRRSLEGS